LHFAGSGTKDCHNFRPKMIKENPLKTQGITGINWINICAKSGRESRLRRKS